MKKKDTQNSVTKIKFQIYKKEIQNINDILFELYNIRGDIKTFGHAFSDFPYLCKLIRKIEDLLMSLTNELENISPQIDNDDILLPISNFPKLEDFIKSFGKSNQRKKFANLYQEIVKLIRIDNI